MKRTFVNTPKLSSIALACALSLSASISGAAGEIVDYEQRLVRPRRRAGHTSVPGHSRGPPQRDERS